MRCRFPSPRTTGTALPRAVLLALLLAATGCQPVRFISEYDPETDARLTELQRGLETMLTEMERTAGTPGGAVARYLPQYDALRVELRSLAVRAAAREKNQLQVDQLAEVLRQIDLLEEAHAAGLTPEEIPIFRDLFAQSFRAMLTLELAKRRGDPS